METQQEIVVTDSDVALSVAKDGGSAHNSRKNLRRKAASVLVLLMGVALLVYPVIATVINNTEHHRIVYETMRKSQDLGPQVLERSIAEAKNYNQRLRIGPVLDPFLQKVVPNSDEYRQYVKMLDFSGVMGSVHIPKIKVQLPIYHGTDDATLAKGVGHLFGSSLPIGGVSTKAVLTAHSGLGNATMFDELPNLGKGDSIFVRVAGQTLKYSVIKTDVVKPDKTDGLQLENGKDLLVLITCTPYGVNTHRLLVTAERVPYDEKVDGGLLDVQATPWRIWMAASLGIVSVALCIYLWMVFRKRKPTETQPNGEADQTLDTQNPQPFTEGGAYPD